MFGLAPAIIDGQRKGRRLRRLSPRQADQCEAAGGPDPPETKVGVTFLKRAATIERAWHSGCYHRDMPRRMPPPSELVAAFILGVLVALVILILYRGIAL